MRTILVAVLLGFSYLSWSQSYLQTGDKWQERYVSGFGGVTVINDYIIQITGDTLIQGISYYKMHATGNGISINPFTGDTTFSIIDRALNFIREEGSKFYMRYINGEKTLLHEFNLTTGDTAISNCNRPQVVEKVDTFLIGSNFRRQYHFEGNGYKSTFFEGIGSAKGLYTPPCSSIGIEANTILICYEQNGHVVQVDSSNSCRFYPTPCLDAMDLPDINFPISLASPPPSLGNLPSCDIDGNQNPLFIRFYVDTLADIRFSIKVDSCEGAGYQAAIFKDCSAVEPIVGFCNCRAIDLNFDITLAEGYYYLLLDGCEGDICSFTNVSFQKTYEYSCDLSEPNIMLIDTIVCPGELITVNFPAVEDARYLVWQPSNLIMSEGPNLNGFTMVASETTNVLVAVANECDTSEFAVAATIEVPQSEGFDTLYLCDINDSPCGFDTCHFDIPTITAQGCDSTIHVTSIVVEPSNEVIIINNPLCQTDPNAMDSVVILTDQFGCDSTIFYRPIIYPSYNSVLTVKLCEGDEYMGQAYFSDTLFTDSLLTTQGCDSIFTTNIRVAPNYVIEYDTILLLGEPYNGIPIFRDTTIVEELQSIEGCDSIVTVHIMVTILSSKDLTSDECQLSIYPVPTKSVLTILADNCKKLKISTMYNHLGRVVWQSQWLNMEQHTIDISEMPAGIYYLQVQQHGELHLLKIVKL